MSVTEIHRGLLKRLQQLEGAVREHNELQKLLTLLNEKTTTAPPSSSSESARRAPVARKPRQRKRGGRAKRLPEAQRKEQIVSLVAERPMIDPAGIASATRLSKPRVSQLTSALIKEGRLQRSDGGFMAAPTND
jgi:hypothetical protein